MERASYALGMPRPEPNPFALTARREKARSLASTLTPYVADLAPDAQVRTVATMPAELWAHVALQAGVHPASDGSGPVSTETRALVLRLFAEHAIVELAAKALHDGDAYGFFDSLAVGCQLAGNGLDHDDYLVVEDAYRRVVRHAEDRLARVRSTSALAEGTVAA